MYYHEICSGVAQEVQSPPPSAKILFTRSHFVNQTEQNRTEPPHELVAFIQLRQTIYNKFVQLREFVETLVQTNLTEQFWDNNMEMLLHEAGCL